MFMITPVNVRGEGRASAMVWRVQGSLRGQQAIETLHEACATHLGERGPALTLDLSELRFVDEAGATALRALMAGGVRVRGCPPLVRELLNAAPAGAGTGPDESEPIQ